MDQSQGRSAARGGACRQTWQGRFKSQSRAGRAARLAHDPIFATSLVNTFELPLMIVPPLTVLALLLALALNSAGKGAALIRGVFFSSAVLSVTIVTLIWRFVLAPDAGLLGETWKS